MAAFAKHLRLSPTVLYFLVFLALLLICLFTTSGVSATTINTTQQNTQSTTEQSSVVIIPSASTQTQSSPTTQNSSTDSEAGRTISITEVSTITNQLADPTIGQVGSSAETTSKNQATDKNPVALWTAIAFSAATIGYLVFSVRPSTRQ